MNLRNGIIVSLLLQIVHISCFAQNTDSTALHEFSVADCINYASNHNLQIKNALTAVQIQEQTNRGITSAALPNISASANITDYLKLPTSLLPGEFFGQPPGTYIPVQFGTKYNSNASANLQQVLFDGQVFVGLQARKTSIDFRQKNVDVVMEDVKANIYKVYYQLVVSKTQISQLDANLELLQKAIHDANEMFKNGFVEKLDIDKYNVQLSNLQTEKQSVENQVANGYLGLKLLIGMPVKDSLVLTEEITDDKIKDGLLAGADYDYNNRQDYQYAMLGKKLNEYNIKRYKLAALPTLSLTGSYSKQAQRTKFNIFGPGNWFTTAYAGLNLNIPIFDGFNRRSKLAEAKLELQQTNDQIDFLKITIDKDVQEALNNYRTAVNTIDFQKMNMELAQKVYDQTKKKYEIGTGSNYEVTNAQTELRLAQANYVNALYSAIIAKIDYLKAIGKLN